MTQDEKWHKSYDEVIKFLKGNHRNLSKYNLEERRLYTWMKHNRKVYNAGKMNPERVDAFEKLLTLMEENKHLNQWK